jgi:malate dehydrogenase (oxaloacetate-decarboxylating)
MSLRQTATSLASLGINLSSPVRQFPNTPEVAAMVRKLGAVQHGDSKLISPDQVAEILRRFGVPGRTSFRSCAPYLAAGYHGGSTTDFVRTYLDAIRYPCYPVGDERRVRIPSLKVLAEVYTPGVGFICNVIKHLFWESIDLRLFAADIGDDKTRQALLYRANALYGLGKALSHTNLIIPVNRASNLAAIRTKIAAIGKAVYVITDGTAILGLGDIGPQAGAPVMTGKAILISGLADVPAISLILDETDPDKMVDILTKILPERGGSINLEDLSSPHSFEVERKLQDRIAIPVFDDDQWGTGIVVAAALINGARLMGKPLAELTVHFQGAGAGAIGVALILIEAGVKPGNIQMADSRGLLHAGRRDGMNEEKEHITAIINSSGRTGSWENGLRGADVYIGLSAAEADKRTPFTLKHFLMMNERPGIVSLANPNPEILATVDEPLGEAYARFRDGGAAFVGTGRSDAPNGINNVLGFPSIHKAGGFLADATSYQRSDYVVAARAIAGLLGEVTPDRIIVDPLDERVVPVVSEAVAGAIRQRQQGAAAR